MFSTACSHNLILSTLHHPELVAMGENVDWSPQQTAEDTPIHLSVFNPHYLTHEQDPEKILPLEQQLIPNWEGAFHLFPV